MKHMSTRPPSAAPIILAILTAAGLAAFSRPASSGEADAPTLPKVIDPGSPSRSPADAIVLFDGTDLSRWRHHDSRPAEWPIKEGAVTVKPRSGGIFTIATFADVQLHIEFASPESDGDEGQGKGNSGVYLQGRYEVQILDSYQNETYPDGQCGAIYGQHPPLVNAARPAGEWQAYDITFHPPAFDETGKRLQMGTVTVFHNGVLVQDNVQLRGDTTASPLKEAPTDGPLYLQDHGDLVRYRNIWIRPIPPPAMRPQGPGAPVPGKITVPPEN